MPDVLPEHDPGRITSYRVFWPYYLAEHSRPATRALHYVGSAGALICLGLAIVLEQPWWLAGMVLSGYGFAWIGHVFVEGNNPVTFRYPLWSLMSDFRMFGLWVVGKELAGARSKRR
jgi:hypothetical protein